MGITRKLILTVMLGAMTFAPAVLLAQPAQASSALGCTFDALGPYKNSSGTLYTKLQVRCASDTWLYWHARLTKDISYWPDRTVGSSDGYDLFQGGSTYTWYLTNNSVSCPGSGNYFGKLTIQTGTYSTAYVDRSSDVYYTHC